MTSMTKKKGRKVQREPAVKSGLGFEQKWYKINHFPIDTTM